MYIFPSSAEAVHSSALSGDTSNPSQPLETGMMVCSQLWRGCIILPGGGGGLFPCGAPPGGGGGMFPIGISVSCRMLTVPEATLVVYIFFALLVT